jgi:lysozyme family protein
MKGVTQRTYSAYRRRKGISNLSVRHIKDDEVTEIYKTQYWDAVRGDDLPAGLAYCVYDAAVNSGPSRAAKWLQRLVGVARDGVIGNQTLAAVLDHDVKDLIDRYCDYRLAFMKRLRHWSSFKNGWTRRVAEVREQSKKWADGYVVTPATVPLQPIAAGPENIWAALTTFFINLFGERV